MSFNRQWYLACVASVPVRAKCYVLRASEDSSRAKIGARAKKGKEQGGGGAGREWAAPPPPRSFSFFALAPIFALPESLLARHIALRSHGNACYAG